MLVSLQPCSPDPDLLQMFNNHNNSLDIFIISNKLWSSEDTNSGADIFEYPQYTLQNDCIGGKITVINFWYYSHNMAARSVAEYVLTVCKINVANQT